MVLLVLSFIQIGKESPLSSILHGFVPKKQSSEDGESKQEQAIMDEEEAPGNKLFMIAIMTQVLVSIVYLAYLIIFSVEQLHWVCYLILVLTILALLGYEENEKNSIREQYGIDGRMMSIFFTTRLGMWSPR